MKKKFPIVRIEFTPKTLFFTLASLVAVYFLWLIKDIVITVLVSVIIATAIYPTVKRLERYRIPRQLSAAVILILAFAAVIGIFATLVPPVVTQISRLFELFPYLLRELGRFGIDASSFGSQLVALPGEVFKVLMSTFSASLAIMPTFFISYYVINERAHLNRYLRLFGDRSQEAKETIEEVEMKLGYWVRGELILMMTVGVMSYVGYRAVGLDYALPLAVVAGILELVPNLGPTLAAIPAAIVGFSMSPLHGILALVVGVIVQQLENNLIVPLVMRRTIGLHPIITIISLLIGFQLGGPLLAILALPIVLIIQVVLVRWYRQNPAFRMEGSQ